MAIVGVASQQNDVLGRHRVARISGTLLSWVIAAPILGCAPSGVSTRVS